MAKGNPKMSITKESGSGNRFPTGGGVSNNTRHDPRSAPGAKTGSNSLAKAPCKY